MYHFSDQFLPDYSGGYWEFVTLSNGGKFTYPEMGEPVAVNNDYNCVSTSLESNMLFKLKSLVHLINLLPKLHTSMSLTEQKLVKV